MDRLIDDKYATLQLTNPTTASNTPTLFGTGLLGGITVGSSDNNRVGNVIRVKKVTFHGVCNNNTQDRIRVIFGWDKQCNGASPAGGELLSQNDVFATYNHDTVVGAGGGRFNIEKDHIYMIEPKITATPDYHEIKFTWTGDKIVRYDTSAGTIVDVVSNNFFGLAVCAVGSAGGSSITGYFDVTYNDA
jgi:hypothetical protein